MKLDASQQQELVASSDQRQLLVVEDDLLIRTMLCEILRQSGYSVIEASNADEALAIMTVIPPQLIITDVRMPGSMSGTELLARVRTTNLSLPVIVTSGHLQNLEDEATARTHFLPKPYRFDELIDLVERELHS